MKSAPVADVGSRRDDIDVIKGFGIFFVVLNHCFARTSRKFGLTAVTEDSWLYFINRLIHFAVPIFLFVSCALLAQSVARKFDIRRYANSRWRKTVIPFLLASLFYWRLVNGSPLGSQDRFLELVLDTVSGKASFHLYFTVVLIQASVLVPVIVLFLKKLNGGSNVPQLPWLPVLMIAAALQLVVFYAQREWWHLDRPGSLITWYLVPLLVGVTVGTQDFRSQASRFRKLLLSFAVLFGLAYALVAVVSTDRWQASSDLINGTYVLYTGFLALALWLYADILPASKLRAGLADLGRRSLPLFLVHPAIMFALGGPKMTSLLLKLPFPGLWFWLLTLTLSYGFARIMFATRLGRAILGEDAPPAKSPPAATATT